MSGIRNRAGGGASRTGAAFTLIELLLVLVIIAVVTAVTVPNFIRSMRGNQRRSAVRIVMSAGRYARSMAVLTQEPMALVFDIAGARIRVESRKRATPRTEGVPAEEDAEPTTAAGVPIPAGRPAEDDGAGPAARESSQDLERRLEQIAIAAVDIGDEHFTAGTPEIVYRTNGRCTPYRLRLADERGWGVTIDVDALSSAQTEEETIP